MQHVEISLTCTMAEAQALAACAKRFGHRDALNMSETTEQAAQMMQGMYELHQQIEQQTLELNHENEL